MTTQLDLFTGHRTGEYEVPDNPVRKCLSCQADIIWTKTGKDKAMPLSVATIEWHDGKRWAMPHFIDCPQGKEWSKRNVH